MRLLEHADLSAGNTLALPCVARYLARPESLEDVAFALASARAEQCPVRVLGEGSNVVLAPHLEALVLQPANRGIRCLEQTDDTVLVEVAAGENWDALVGHCVDKGWYGLENLSLIPGSVGASPFQNIGAYGVELADFLEDLDAVSLQDGVTHTFPRAQCGFAYRDSVFKSSQAGRWLIWRVRLRLSRRFAPQLGYGELQQQFAALPTAQQTAAGLRRLVTRIRQDKLPDPSVLPNAGSFFKNPVIPAAQHQALKERFPGLVSYAQPGGDWKLAAGWLIEQAGFKGLRDGALGMHARQALVLVNHGDASAEQVRQFAERVRQAVSDMFGVTLEQEPVLFD
mgnify:CR=1 FL=1|jgi:UDP-N-acetylmuramate dehydrogenase